MSTLLFLLLSFFVIENNTKHKCKLKVDKFDAFEQAQIKETKHRAVAKHLGQRANLQWQAIGDSVNLKLTFTSGDFVASGTPPNYLHLGIAYLDGTVYKFENNAIETISTPIGSVNYWTLIASYNLSADQLAKISESCPNKLRIHTKNKVDLAVDPKIYKLFALDFSCLDSEK